MYVLMSSEKKGNNGLKLVILKYFWFTNKPYRFIMWSTYYITLCFFSPWSDDSSEILLLQFYAFYISVSHVRCHIFSLFHSSWNVAFLCSGFLGMAFIEFSIIQKYLENGSNFTMSIWSCSSFGTLHIVY